jgi:phage replication O-like protein O
MEVEIGGQNIDRLSPAAGKHLLDRVRRELQRHDVSDRDRRVAEALCEVSFGFGLRSVKIPKLDTLGEITGLPRQHVYTALLRLHERRIVTVQQKQGLHLYTINPNSESWKVPPRMALATVLRGLETIREINDVPADESSSASENSAICDPRQILLPGVTDDVTVSREKFPEGL